MSLTRRQFIRNTAIGVAAVGGMGLTAEALVLEPGSPVGEHVEVWLKRLPEAFEGFRIAQFTDIHFGPYMDRPRLERAMRLGQAFQPDVVALTGDFVSHPLGQRNGDAGARNAEPCADVFARWQGVLIFAVLGNHDHWNNSKIVTAALAERGIQVMKNRARPFERNGQKLWLSGIDDVLDGQVDLPAALKKIPAGDATILLAHEPDFADHASKFPIDLQLSGHSHGGQVQVPGVGPIILPPLAHKYPVGLNRVGNLQVYTSRGIGVINPPVRLNCPPEVTLITLRRDTL